MLSQMRTAPAYDLGKLRAELEHAHALLAQQTAIIQAQAVIIKQCQETASRQEEAIDKLTKKFDKLCDAVEVAAEVPPKRRSPRLTNAAKTDSAPKRILGKGKASKPAVTQTMEGVIHEVEAETREESASSIPASSTDGPVA